MTVQVLESFGFQRQVARPVLQVVAPAQARTFDRAAVNRELARIAAGRRMSVRLCCGMAPRRTVCPRCTGGKAAPEVFGSAPRTTNLR